jgi:hypothetical protein
MKVTMQHVRTVPGFRPKPGLCLAAVRPWCAQHDLDFRALVRVGLEEETLLATGDAFAIAVVKWAHECEARHGRQ